jgi:membrane protein implicated in regulation of membrane protease activity
MPRIKQIIANWMSAVAEFAAVPLLGIGSIAVGIFFIWLGYSESAPGVSARSFRLGGVAIAGGLAVLVWLICEWFRDWRGPQTQQPRHVGAGLAAPAQRDAVVIRESPKRNRYLVVGLRESDGTHVEREIEGASGEEVRVGAMLDGIDVLRVNRLESDDQSQSD